MFLEVDLHEALDFAIKNSKFVRQVTEPDNRTCTVHVRKNLGFQPFCHNYRHKLGLSCHTQRGVFCVQTQCSSPQVQSYLLSSHF